MKLTEYVRLSRVDPRFTVPFHLRALDGEYLVTTDLGDHAFLTPDELRRTVEGDVQPGEPLWERLRSANLLASEIDVTEQARRYWRKKSFLGYGPSLHAFVLTERCNHGCQYCHSSIVGMSRLDTDMTREVASKAVDVALSTTSPWLNIEFQGGEPTANWDVLTYIVEQARERNRRLGKQLSFSLVTNFSLMTEERLDWLLENRVQICTSLDGPEDLHNRIRIFSGGNSHALTVRWIARVNERYREMGLDPILYRVEALPTITRHSLHRWKDIVDEYVRVGCRAVFLRKLDPFGFAEATRKNLGYSMDEFLEFYRNALAYVIELNKQGVQVMERNAAIMLCKIVGDYDPNYLDLRTPGGAAIGQLAYHPNGNVYSSDEGRMVAAMGDDAFLIGNVERDSYRDIMGSGAVRALVLASTNDAQPGCATCVYKAWCGQQPEYNYKTQGSIFGRMQDSAWCTKHKGIFDTLLTWLKNAPADERELISRWTISRPQEHYLQDAGPGGEVEVLPAPVPREADEPVLRRASR